MNSTSQETFDFNKWVEHLDETVMDIDSNIYQTQKIGNQIWLRENLKVTNFNNGKEISFKQSDSLWSNSQEPSYSKIIGIIDYRGNAKDSILTNHLVYNYWVVSDSQNVCPMGWKVPCPDDWRTIEEYLKLANEEFMYASGTVYPRSSDTIDVEIELDWNMLWSDNYDIGFTSNPFGYRVGGSGEFIMWNDFGYWWSSDLYFVSTAWARIQNRGFGFDDIHLEENRGNKQNGYAIKCVKD